ncbi:MAG: 6-phosphogluconolactonase [Bacteroidales bacterium]|jgi:6-phosphogluconolactonase|nr:6-phosphogluconolactonase [Bacteroidales bacterium]
MSALPIVKIYANKQKLADTLAKDFISYINRLTKSKEQVDIAISGGSTPTLFFRAMVKLNPQIAWEKIGIYWVDERCVEPDHSESNYGVALREFITPLHIPMSSVFRMIGENDSDLEAERYSNIIMDQVSPEMTFPVFDLVFLGLGADGHTASIFPNQMALWNIEKLCAVGIHPESGQKRVTITGHLINAAEKVVFLVSGNDKAEVVRQLIKNEGDYLDFPASLVKPHRGELEWYLDEEAARLIKDI